MEHAWAFDKDTPQRRISSLELYGTAVLVKLIITQVKDQSSSIPIFTDNQGNALALLSNRQKRWPNAVLIMDLSVSLHMSDQHIRPHFLKREFNEWADQLTHSNSAGFNKERQLCPPPVSEWPALPSLISAYAESNATNPTGALGPEKVRGGKRVKFADKGS